jgi:hypothetical protein
LVQCKKMKLPGQRNVHGECPQIFPGILSDKDEFADILMINGNRNPNKIIVDINVFLTVTKKLISTC